MQACAPSILKENKDLEEKNVTAMDLHNTKKKERNGNSLPWCKSYHLSILSDVIIVL